MGLTYNAQPPGSPEPPRLRSRDPAGKGLGSGEGSTPQRQETQDHPKVQEGQEIEAHAINDGTSFTLYKVDKTICGNDSISEIFFVQKDATTYSK